MPFSWTNYHWGVLTTWKRCIEVIGMMAFFELTELNCFLLKHAMWIAPGHYLVICRCAYSLSARAIGLRPGYILSTAARSIASPVAPRALSRRTERTAKQWNSGTVEQWNGCERWRHRSRM